MRAIVYADIMALPHHICILALINHRSFYASSVSQCVCVTGCPLQGAGGKMRQRSSRHFSAAVEQEQEVNPLPRPPAVALSPGSGSKQFSFTQQLVSEATPPQLQPAKSTSTGEVSQLLQLLSPVPPLLLNQIA